MTTYLATILGPNGEEITIPFCSRTCRNDASLSGGWGYQPSWDDHAEFVETCFTCQREIPAGLEPEPFTDLFDHDGARYLEPREVITSEEAARRLRARYAPGVKEEVKFS